MTKDDEKRLQIEDLKHLEAHVEVRLALPEDFGEARCARESPVQGFPLNLQDETF